jgi:hypothetical protein
VDNLRGLHANKKTTIFVWREGGEETGKPNVFQTNYIVILLTKNYDGRTSLLPHWVNIPGYNNYIMTTGQKPNYTTH